MPKEPATAFHLKASLLSALEANNRIAAYLIENIASEAWSANPPEGKGRTIAAIIAHIHNVRLMWLKAIGAATLPAKLEDTASPAEAVQALQVSHDALTPVLSEAFETGHVKNFKPDAASFFVYLIAHESHHRGQIASLTRRLGHPLPKSVGFGMWQWSSRAKEIASDHPNSRTAVGPSPGISFKPPKNDFGSQIRFNREIPMHFIKFRMKSTGNGQVQNASRKK